MHLNDEATVTVSAGEKCRVPNLLLSGGRRWRGVTVPGVQGQVEGTVWRNVWPAVMSVVAQHPLWAVIRLR